MKKSFIVDVVLTVLLVLSCSGCAPMLAVSAVSTVATGKSLADHTVSLVSGADCSTLEFARGEQDYYCERRREPGTTYNRSKF
jgi:hypothetical protein